jgi:mono/diheme cytochrome c family protein
VVAVHCSAEKLRFLIAALLLASPALADEGVGLKPGPGLDAVTSSCATCHTLDYIRMNSVFLTPDAWKAEVAKMIIAFGAPIDDAAAKTITDYLSANYAAPSKP